MTALTLADGSITLTGVLLVALVGVAFASCSVEGIGIDHHSWAPPPR